MKDQVLEKTAAIKASNHSQCNKHVHVEMLTSMWVMRGDEKHKQGRIYKKNTTRVEYSQKLYSI